MRANQKRSLLQELFDKVPDDYATLLVAIKTKRNEWNAAIKSGTPASISANGHALGLRTDKDSLSPEDLAGFGGELRDLYDTASAAVVASGIASPTDAQIYAEMIDRLQPVTSFTSDYSTLRCAR